MGAFILGVIIGFVVGVLFGRRNAKTVEAAVGAAQSATGKGGAGSPSAPQPK